MKTFLFTGFPGFLGSELIPRVLARSTNTTATCLVQPKYAVLASRRAEELAIAWPAVRGRIRIVEGDITLPGLGLAEAAAPKDEVVEIFHLAAIYDLSVERDLAMRVNVDGTRNMLDFAAGCPNLERFQYVSTCYVSGRHEGAFLEEDLDKGQTFNNYYEETKYLAEVEVRKRMQEGLRATIYRPAIVVGDTHSGATQKYDGPYFAIQWLLRQPKLAIMPVVGDATETELNLVPRDFVVEAIAHLSALPQSAGKTYHLADPAPLTVDAMLDALARATGRRVLRLPLPQHLAKWALDRVPGVYRVVRIPSSALDYFVHPTRYDTRQTQEDLAGSGIAVPRFPDYADTLVAFVRSHPEIGAAPMA